MHVSTHEPTKLQHVQNQDQFLIVPIFFKNQIESLMRANAPDSIFGFFYGEQRDNYRIIKKIWPVPHNADNPKNVTISALDFDRARELEQGDSLRLLGCFYTSKRGGLKRAIIADQDIDSFSFVQLDESDSETCTWTSSKSTNHRLYQEKVIL